MHFFFSKYLLPVLYFSIALLLLQVTAALSSDEVHSCLPGRNKKDSHDQIGIFQNITTTADANKFKQLLFKELKRLSGTSKKIQKRIEKHYLKTHQLKRECKKRASTLPNILENISEHNVVKSLAQVFKDFRQLKVMSNVVATVASDNMDTYQDDLTKLKKIFTDTMCYAESLADHYRLELYQGLSDDDMLAEFKNMTDQATRDRRNCVFMRDISQLLNRMKKSYK